MGNDISRSIPFTVSVWVEASRTGVAIGKAGAQAKAIMEKTGLSLETPPKDTVGDAEGRVPIRFRGKGDQLAAASMIENLIPEAKTLLELDFTKQPQIVSRINKVTVDRVASESGAVLISNMDRVDSKTLTIKGNHKQVTAAFTKLNATVYDEAFLERRMSGDANLGLGEPLARSPVSSSPFVPGSKSIPRASKTQSSTPIPMGSPTGSYPNSPRTEGRRAYSTSRNERDVSSFTTNGSYISSSMEGSFRNSSFQSRSLSSSMGGRGVPRQAAPKPEYLCEEIEDGLRITVDKSKIGYLIGRQSSTVTRIKQESGASIEVDSKACTIVITGEPQAMQKAKESFEQLINETRSLNEKRHIFFEGVPSFEHQVKFVKYEGPCSGKLKNEQLFVLESTNPTDEESDDVYQSINDQNTTRFLEAVAPVLQAIIGQGSVISISALVGRLIFYRISQSIQCRSLTVDSVQSKLKNGDIRSRFEATDSAADLPWLRDLIQTSTSTAYSLTMGIATDKESTSRLRVKTSRMTFKPNESSESGLESVVELQDTHELTADFVDIRHKHNIRLVIKFASHPFPSQFEEFCKSMKLESGTGSLSYNTEGPVQVYTARMLSIQSLAAQDCVRPVITQSQTIKRAASSIVSVPASDADEDNEVHRELQLFHTKLDRMFQAPDLSTSSILGLQEQLVDFLKTVRSLMS